jgi:FkbM family methyltransferase
LFGAGDYPSDVEVRTPLGPIRLRVYSHDDVLTVNEIFCRCDYEPAESDTLFVDFGSNIGISAAYFLTRNRDSFAYLFEPLARNNERMRPNLKPFEGRYLLTDAAVGMSDGEFEFGWEETGRYGGIGKQTGRYTTVKCLDSNRVLEEILARHGRIDVLKIDIETLEQAVIEKLTPMLCARIGKIFAECEFTHNPLKATHAYTQYGSVARFTRLS